MVNCPCHVCGSIWRRSGIFDMKQVKLPLWRLLWQLVRFRLGTYLVDVVLISGYYLSLLGPGLVLQRFFDELTGAAPFQLGIWALLAILAGLVLGGSGSLLVAI